MLNTYDVRSNIAKTVCCRVADKDLNVIDSKVPRTDGKNVYLPITPDGTFLDNDDLIGISAHEGSHIRFESAMDKDILVHICANINIASVVLNIFEDHRCEILLERIYPGFYAPLKKLNERLSKRLYEKLISFPENFVDIGLLYHVNRELHKNAIDARSSYGNFWKEAGKSFDTVEKYLSFSSSVLASKMYVEAMKKFLKTDESMRDDLQRSKASASIDVSGKIMLPDDGWKKDRICRNLFGKDSSPEMVEKMLNDDREMVERIVEMHVRSTSNEGKSIEFSEQTFVDEGTPMVNRIFESGFDALNRLTLERNIEPRVYYRKTTAKHATTIKEMRSLLNKIRTLRSQTERGARRGMISTRDLASVISTDGRYDRPFVSKTRSKGARILVIVDESGSMEMDGGTKMRCTREAVVMLSESLRDTSIDFAIVGFSATGAKHVIVEKVYKRFGCRLVETNIASIGCCRDHLENRDGTSFETIARNHLACSRGGEVQCAIVISDGRPSHGGTSYVGIAGCNRTAKSVKKLMQKYKMFAISIDTGGSDYLKTIYGNKFVAIGKPEDLGRELLYLVKMIATSV